MEIANLNKYKVKVQLRNSAYWLCRPHPREFTKPVPMRSAYEIISK